MSRMVDYIFVKDRILTDFTELFTALEITEYEAAIEVDMCETGIVRHLYTGEINNGSLIFGPSIAYFVIHNPTLQNKLLNYFRDDEVFCNFYDDRVMSFGFVLIKNGEIVRSSEFDEGEVVVSGETTGIESKVLWKETEAQLKEGVSEEEIAENIESIVLMKAMQEYEIQYLGEELMEMECQSVTLKKYKLK